MNRRKQTPIRFLALVMAIATITSFSLFATAQGYKAALCYGWEQAAGTIIEYLTGGGTHD